MPTLPSLINYVEARKGCRWIQERKKGVPSMIKKIRMSHAHATLRSTNETLTNEQGADLNICDPRQASTLPHATCHHLRSIYST
jgi:hypothetical protein